MFFKVTIVFGLIATPYPFEGEADGAGNTLKETASQLGGEAASPKSADPCRAGPPPVNVTLMQQPDPPS